MHYLRTSVILSTFLGLSLATQITYEGFKVYKLSPKTEADNVFLRRLESDPNFDFWSRINRVGKPVSVMVPPKYQKLLEHGLESNKIDFEIQIENVEKTIQPAKAYHGRSVSDQYFRHAEINAYLNQLAEDYPDIVTVESIGQSYEGRDMNIIRISDKSGPKPIIFIDAGIHAREWIAPAVALYTINQLVENPDNRNLSSSVEWIILPSLNPDGYEYSWDSDRYWRNTRSPGERCHGCDANRNFGFHWMEPGTLSDGVECSEVYAGKEAFSEVETRNLRDFFNGTAVSAYLSLHSFGEYLVYPWGYTEELIDNWEELDQLGNNVAAAIGAVRGTVYTVGDTATSIYLVGGASQDWVMGVAGVPIVYSMELPSGGSNGFNPPESDIQAIGEETFEGFKVLGEYVAQKM